jgi:hypothetical protein
MKYIPIGYFNNIAFGPETELSLVIDSTANLADTKTQLDTLVSTDLKNLLLPFYGTEAKYNEKVKVIENDTERPYSMLTTFNLSSKNSFVFAFIDEATPYGDVYSTANANVTADIYSLVNKVSGYKDEYRGFIFRVKDTDSTLFSESQQLREVLYTVYNSHVPYTDTNFNEIQLPITRENQIFNRLDIATVDELTRYAGATNTVMTNATRYKYYGYEIIKALNDSIVTLNIANDISPLMCQIENIIGYQSQDAFNMPIINIENTIQYLYLNAIDISIPNIGNFINYSSRDGVTSQFTNIQNNISYATQNTALPKINLESVIAYTSLPAIAL